MEALNELLTWSQTWGSVALFVFLRVGAVMALLPAFGERSIPERVRLVLALCFTAIVLPAVSPHIEQLDLGAVQILRAVATEVCSGLLVGIVLRVFIMALQIAGAIAAQSTSLSQIFGGGAVDAQPAIGHMFFIAGLTIAVMTGLHVRVAELLILSYEYFPPGYFVPPDDVMVWGVGHVSRAFALAFSLAAPFVIASLVYNVALGVINRAMPSLMVAFVGAPAITAGGLLLLFATMPLALEIWRDGFLDLLSDPFGAP